MPVLGPWIGFFGVCWACSRATTVRAYDADTMLCQRCTANFNASRPITRITSP